MNKIRSKFQYLLDMPKTMYFNFRVFPIPKALKLPIRIGRRVRIGNVYKGAIVIADDIKRNHIRIGVGGVEARNCGAKGYITVSKGHHIFFNGHCIISEGCIIEANEGDVVFGKGFTASNNLFVAGNAGISFGEDVLVGWNVALIDKDAHKVGGIYDDEAVIHREPINIGDHVWIGAESSFLKGCIIPNGCIIGYNSCVTKKFDEENCVIAGYPAKVVKHNIYWER